MEMFFKNIRYIRTCRLKLRNKAKFNQQKNENKRKKYQHK